MSLTTDIIQTIKEKHPSWDISRLGHTYHSNVVLLKNGNQRFIAKSIWFDEEDPTDEERAQHAFETEVAILQMLPKWWGIQYVDSFVSPSKRNRIIITTEFQNVPWKTLEPKHFLTIARSIQRQLSWLHSHKISHNDLELKNILLGKDQQTATIIDFEKSKLEGTRDQMEADKRMLLENAQSLNPIFGRVMKEAISGRRMSMGGKRRTRRRRRY